MRIMLGTRIGLAIGVAIAALVLPGQPGSVDAQSRIADRMFEANWASPGSEMTVTISAQGYGPFGQVVETLPAGFSYVRSSLEAGDVDEEGRTIRFTLFGVSSFSYVVKVPRTEGRYTFSGIIKNSNREEGAIAGDSQFRVGPTPTPTPSPTPTATPTPSPTPTPTATPTPTITPSPTPSPTATLVPTSTPDIEATVDARVAAVLSTAAPSTAVAEEPTPTPEPPAQPEEVLVFSNWVPLLLIGILIGVLIGGLLVFYVRQPR